MNYYQAHRKEILQKASEKYAEAKKEYYKRLLPHHKRIITALHKDPQLIELKQPVYKQDNLEIRRDYGKIRRHMNELKYGYVSEPFEEPDLLLNMIL